MATVDDDGVQLHQYLPAVIRTGGIELEVETDYPRDGSVRVRTTRDADTPWTLTLRVPSWANGARLVVRPVGEAPTEQDADPGVVSVRRAFRAGDLVELVLPVAPRFTAPDPRIDAVRGCLAVERGPEVLCLESVDLAVASSGRLDDTAAVRVDRTVAPREEDGAVVVRLQALVAQDAPWPYGAPAADRTGDRVDVPLVAYHDWAERGPSTMRIWLPVAP